MDCSLHAEYFLNHLSEVSGLPDNIRHSIQHGSNQEFLGAISSAALQPHLTERIFVHFEPLAFEICARWNIQNVAATIQAFARILPVFPHLGEVAYEYFSSLNDQNILSCLGNFATEENVSRNRDLLLAVHRLLNFDNERFAKFILPAKLQLYLQHDDLATRHLTVKVICQFMRASDGTIEDMKAKYLEQESTAIADWDGSTIDYEFLSLWEAKRLNNFQNRLIRTRAARSDFCREDLTSRILQADDFSPPVLMTAGVLLPRKLPATSSELNDNYIVPNATTNSNLRLLADALIQPYPVLLTGYAGSGKTTLVRHLADQAGKLSSMITLHLNEQSDAKLLIGLYTTGKEAGSFKWQPGVLSTAVSEGRWVFIEDVDRAPSEVMSTLLPLIERGELLVPSQGQKIKAAAGFKIIATMRSIQNFKGEATSPISRMLGKRLWNVLHIDVLSSEEIKTVIASRYPLLTSVIGSMMTTYDHITNIHDTTSTMKSDLRDRPISCRELFKWAERVHATLEHAHLRNGGNSLSEADLDSMYLDAVDCFAGNLKANATKDILTTKIAQDLHVDPQRKTYLLENRAVSLKKRNIIGDGSEAFRIGRAMIPIRSTKRSVSVNRDFALNGFSLRLLERVAVAVQQREPALLIGETGIGKTAAIQHLAQLTNNNLTAINLSQQSEAGDLLGGLKPANTRSMAIPLKDDFDLLFGELFSQKKNQEFSEQLSKCISKSQWKRAAMLWNLALQKAQESFPSTEEATPGDTSQVREQQAKRRKLHSQSFPQLHDRIKAFSAKLEAFQRQIGAPANAVRFEYAEGKLVTAVREGHWVLLDEINLASPDTLESLSDLLEAGPNARPFLILAESGKVERIEAHPNFRLFGAMNPATDVGKKDLPLGIRSRFSEIFVESPDNDSQSLQDIAKLFLERLSPGSSERNLPKIVTDLYQHIQKTSTQESLVDGAGQPTHFSLRTLTRALAHANSVAPQFPIRRALCEGFCLCFLTCLDVKSELRLQELVESYIFLDHRSAKSEMKKSARPPKTIEDFTQVILSIDSKGKGHPASPETHWLPRGPLPIENPSDYILTPYISRNLRNLIRATFTRSHPILIQGPTSAGKTSMVEYLAKRSGNKFVRINNHEHTDLQEYLGTYVSTSAGQLVFQEGVLVQAVREGHWIVLDELNLAPTDILEALNRLLDDNRELLIPETQEVIKPHKNFMLFATQNPAGPYGGRKFLSRAFRNRFIELHFDDIPVDELNTILARRCNLPESWCGLIVEVYRRLSALRQEQRLFEANSFATLRDLFRWAFRGAESVEQLAAQGYMLLSAKVRKKDERESVRKIIEEVMTRKGVRINLDEDIIFASKNCPEMSLYDEQHDGIVWTRPMRRLFALTAHAIRNNEAVLLVGATGCGKTSVCQMIAQAMQKPLHVVNAHQNTETGDLIGAQRPIRNRASIEQNLQEDLREALDHCDTEVSNQDINSLLKAFESLKSDQLNALPEPVLTRIMSNKNRFKALFEWQDGSLVQAMRSGSYYLLDEISLAEDSVLERLNSVLDPSRSLLLAEKGTSDSVVVAKDGFQFFATMNPGGDFGKKELSPALRNRFTEIWVPPLSEVEDVLRIVEAKLEPEAKPYAATLVEFAKWFGETFGSFKEPTISVRDLLSWVDFINSQDLPLMRRILHGAAMVYVDTLGANPSALLEITASAIDSERQRLIQKLGQFLRCNVTSFFSESLDLEINESAFRIGDFELARTNHSQENSSFNFDTPRTKLNAMRIVRALQGPKPILIEGSPGVGKSTIVAAIAKVVGRALTRINLSEQTDLMDLFGSDVPVDNADAGLFTWRDAPFLTAMKRGEWVLLDEMNLASQSVLEGLNACLDHRAEVYVSELDQTFTRHPEFRLFAAQNPHHQGGGRKGLPASFVNRFTVVYADSFRKEDLEYICASSYPGNSKSLMIPKLVEFVSNIDQDVTNQKKYGIRGAPWEFNLRDLLRWLQLIASEDNLLAASNPQDFINLLFLHRFRTTADIDHVKLLFHNIFGAPLTERQYFANIKSKTAQVGLALIERGEYQTVKRSNLCHLTQHYPFLESLMLCVQQNWPVLLVGDSGSGKSYLLSALASIYGAELETYALNADTDATDLVGGFEQVDPSRQVHFFLTRLRVFVLRLLQRSLLRSSGNKTQHTSLLFDMSWYLHNVRANDVDFVYVREQLSNCLSLSSADLIRRFIEECDMLSEMNLKVENARFEWVDGVLVEALESGRWLVLDHANLCSSSVLDRLNSLLEPGGSLLINENCNPDGTPRLIKPHPNFRIFLTVDPHYGEVSRAMRNRAVELFVPLPPHQEIPQQWKFSENVEPSMTGLMSLINLTSSDYSTSQEDYVLDVASERLSTPERGLLQGLTSNPFPDFSVEHAAQLSKLSNRHQMIGELWPNWQNLVYQLYNALESRMDMPSSFLSSQPVHILMNEPLTRLAGTVEPYLDTRSKGSIQSILFDIARLQQTFMNSTELQDLISQKVRTLRNTGSRYTNSLVDGANLLNKVEGAILTWMKSIANDGQFERDVIPFVRNIQSVCWFLLSSMNDTSLDEMRLRVIHQHMSNRINEVKVRSQIPGDFNTGLISSIADFTKTTQLETGLSLESLWSTFRPITATDLESLRSILILENLAEQFDKKRWQMRVPFTELLNLQTAIAKTIDVAYHQPTDVDPLVRKFNDIIAKLKAEDESNEMSHRPWFWSSFELICQLREIGAQHYSQSVKETSKPAELQLLACRPTKLLEPSYRKSTPQSSLDLLVEVAGSKSSSSHRIESVWSYLAESLYTCQDITLDQIDLLQVELQILGGEIARNTTTLVDYVAPKLFSAIIGLCEKLVVMHREVFSDNFIRSVTNLGLHSAITNGSSATEFQQALFRDFDKRHGKLKALMANLLYPLSKIPILEDWASAGSLLHLSNALIGFGLVSLLLYVPNKNFDPILKAQVEVEIYHQRKQSLESKIGTNSQVEKYYTGSLTNNLITLLKEELEELGLAPEAPAVIRPAKSQLGKVQGEFNNVLRLIRPLFDSWTEGGISATVQDPTILENVSSAAQRLGDCPPEYRDLTIPSTKFLQVLQLGLEMGLRYHESQPKNVNDAPPHWAYATFLSGFGEMRLSDLKSINPLSIFKSSSQEIQLLHLKSHALRSSLQSPPRWSWPCKIESRQFFDALYIDWKTQLQKDRRMAEKASSFYHYRGGKDESNEQDEEEFQDLFPTFDNSLTSTRTPEIERSVTPQAVASQVAELHMSIFLSPKDAAQEWIEIIQETFANPQNHSEEQPNSMNDHSMIPSIVLRLHHLYQELSSNQQTNPNYNFYSNSNPPEARKVTVLVHKIQDKIESVVEVWPEHETLRTILAMCKEILQFRRVDPVAKFLIKAEQLHDYLAEWQSVTSREYSAETLYQQLTDLLISWRQLELSTWAKLLDLEIEKCEKDARAWWFMVYENISTISETEIAGDYLDNHVSQLVGALQIFIKNSSVGQFRQKLLLIESLKAQISVTDEKNHSPTRIYDAVDNLVGYYRRFLTSVEGNLSAQRQQLEKQINDVLKLASWSDRNVHALRESAKSSRRKLFRIIKKYREFLSQPVAPLLEQDMPSLSQNPGKEDTYQILQMSKASHSTAMNACQTDNSTWMQRPARMRNIATTVAAMEPKVTSSNADSASYAIHLESFLDNLELSMAELQKETPATLTEETLEKAKHVTTRKKRLFAETLKEVRTMGMTSNPPADVITYQRDLSVSLSRLSSFHTGWSSDTALQGQGFIHSTLHTMDSVRNAATRHHEDVSKADIVRSIGSLESLLAFGTKQHNNLSNYLSQLQDLDRLISQAGAIWDEHGMKVTSKDSSSAYKLEYVKSVIIWLPSFLRVVCKIISAQAKLGDLEFSDILRELTAFADEFDGQKALLSAQPHLPEPLIALEEYRLLNKVHASIESLLTAFEKYSEHEPTSRAYIILNPLVSWIEAHRSTTQNGNGNFHHQGSPLENVDFSQRVMTIADRVLGSIQDVNSNLRAISQASTDERGWLLIASQQLQSMIKAYHLPSIVEDLQSILEVLGAMIMPDEEADEASFTYHCASLAIVMPIIEKYRELAHAAIHQFANLYKATCKTNYVLAKSFTTIAMQGFCKPAEKSEGKGDISEKLESGTGLGEGEGAEDISKDIGEDEDLSELAQDPENQTKKEDMGNEDDAVEIDDALEGAAGSEAEDEHDTQKDEKEEDSSLQDDDVESRDGSVGGGEGAAEEESGEANDDEVGDVDDLGPSAVDEKLWDEAGTEQEKEKQGKQSSETMDKTDQAANAEENSKEDQDDSAEPENADEEDGSQAGDDMSDIEQNNPEDVAEGLDPHLKESEAFDLPEDLQLDGDKSNKEDLDLEDSDNELGDLEDEMEEDVKNAADAEQFEEDRNEQSEPDDGQPTAEKDADDQEETADDNRAEDDPEADGRYGEPDASDQAMEPGGGAADDIKDFQPDQQSGVEARGTGPEEANQDQQVSSGSAQRDSGAETQQTSEQEMRGANARQTSGVEQAPRESRDIEAIKQLGTALEQWHRQHAEIREANFDREEEDREQGDVEMGDNEFEHLPDDGDKHDTQALGAANEDQTQALDDRMAIVSDDKEENDDNRARETSPTDEQDEDYNMQDADVDTSSQRQDQDQEDESIPGAQASSNAFIGERKEPDSELDSPFPEQQDGEDLNEVDDQLSTMDIRGNKQPPPLSTSTDPQTSWQHHEARTYSLSQALTAQLRLILEPTQATKLRGDYRTGKRLNIKRIIPYIASSYKRDKIWMRRSVPSKRAYQVMLAIDDSRSMAEPLPQSSATPNPTSQTKPQAQSKDLAFDTLALLSKALTSLEAGEIAVTGFGESVFLAHDFSPSLSAADGASILRQFTFSQTRTDVALLLRRSIELFADARRRQTASSARDLWQLQMIVSDGICEDHEGIRRLLVRAREERILVVFVVVDAAAASSADSRASASLTSSGAVSGSGAKGTSILDLETVEFVADEGGDAAEGEGEMKLVRRKYLDTFPFAYYLVVKDVTELPHVLATALRQWFAEIAER